ncbi:hypothetical protein KQH49_14440 [Mycetohabitans sp. B5]|uniref:Uncharacterized protein n=1 Tax=Mycetohabitans endofungorum TaxID=417203 RepID=A0A2P5K6P6_9BURK|nr:MULTISPECIES: hypothetical protein [Mycetohabitans]MCG1056049.1 hypothetical protein [Mycetohabitans sp. B5]PPB80689.1 hypothetical protein B0O95_1287 [Mycetohabitans endofungorum]
MTRLTAPSTSPTPNGDQSKQIEVTNNSGVTACILTPTTNNPTDPANGVMVYDQSLELLKATDGTTTINNNATQTFTLDQYYIDPTTHQKKYSTLYNLLVSTADWLSPVANLGVIQIMSKYAPQTVTAESLKSMKEAATFFQTINAYPNSKLTTDFQTAMSGAQTAASKAADGSSGSSDAVADSIADNVNKFFKSTTSYKDVTLASFVAMQSYYQAFPFAWAAYGDKTFYLYATTGSTTQFMGTITLTKPTTLDVTLPNAGYSCTFAPAVKPSDTTSVEVDNSQSKTLVYLNGLFVDSASPDNPALAVKGLFMVKSQFTQTPSDTAIIPVLTGTVNGMMALGFDQPQKSDDKQHSDYWNVLFAPKGVAQIFESVMAWGGAVMLLHFVGTTLYGIYKWARGLGAAKQPTMQEMFEQQLKSIQDALQAQNQDVAQRMSDGQMSAPSSPEAAMQDLAVQTGNIADEVNAASLEDGVNAMNTTMQELAQYMSEMSQDQLTQLEGLGGQLQDVQNALTNATSETLHTVVQEQVQAMKDLHSGMDGFVDSVSESLSAQSAEMIKSNQTAVQEINKQIEESQEEQEKIVDDDDPAAEPIDE